MVTQLKLERVKHGITQLEVAQRTRISAGRLSLLERGIVEPHADEARRFEAFFGVRATRLFTDVGSPCDPVHPQPAA